MDITLPASAAQSGTLRVWLNRIPVSSGTVRVFRVAEDGTTGPEIGRTDVFGRGEGSAATQRSMLLLRLDAATPLHAGETLRLLADEDGDAGLREAELDVLSIE